MANIIVKVGQKSNLRFSNSKVYRAVIAEELKLYAEKVKYDLVIIEKFQSEEYNTVKEFAEKLIESKKNIWFYLPDNDEVTGGLADELGIEPCMTERELFTSIYEKTGYNISVSFSIRDSLLNKDNTDIEKDDFESLFGNIEVSDETDKIIEEQIKIKEENKLEEEKVKLIKEENKLEENKLEEEHQNNEAIHTENSLESKKLNLVKNNIENNNSNESELLDKINKLQKVLNASTNRIDELKKLNKALEDKYNSVINEYKKLEESDTVIEEPISLLEYKKLEKDLTKYKNEIEKLTENSEMLKNEIENLKNNNNDIESNSVSLKSEIEIKNSTIEDLKIQIQSNEEYIDKIKLELETLKEKETEIGELTYKLSSSLRKIDTLHEELEKKDSRIELESLSRVEALETSNKLIEQIDKLNNEINELRTKSREDSELIKSLESSGDNRANIMKQQTEELIDLRIKLEEASEDKENALRLERAAQDKLKIRIQELIEESNSKDMEIQILNKKYSHVSLAAEMSGNNKDILIEQNNELKSANSMLREQIRLMQNEVKNKNKDRTELVASIESLKSKNKQLTTALSSLSVNVLGDIKEKASELTPIQFSGKGQVLAVFGSGSYGISTTAYSIAKRLARNSKVVIVDFDLVSPKMDTYIKINPINSDVPGYNQSEASKFSGLSIFLDKGIDYFLNNVQYIIKSAKEQTKFGRLDYISGCYYKPSAVDIIKADYSTLLTFLTSNYAYVILDFGRLGCSELNDKLIKVFSDAVFKNIVVTTTEKFEARNFRIKLEEDQININKIAWLLNMAKENRLPKDILNYISPAMYSLMPFDYDFYCSKLPFTEASKSCKDKLEQFISSSVF